MRTRLLLAVLLVAAGAARAQSIDPSYQIQWPQVTGNGAPTGLCASPNYGAPYTDITNNVQYHCGSAGWFSNSGGGNTTSSMTSDYIPKATGANAIGNSSLQDNGTTVSTPEPIVGGASVSTTPGSVNGFLDLPSVGTLPGAPAANTVRITSPNTVTPYVIVLPGTAPTSTAPFLNCSAATISICGWSSASASLASPGPIGSSTPSAGAFTILSAQHVVGSSAAPTYVIDAGAGTSPTVSLVAGSTDRTGWINITTGTSPGAGEGIVTVKFNVAWGAAPVCTIFGTNAAAAALSGSSQPYVPQNTTTTAQFVIQANSSALAASTAYQFGYSCP